MQDNTPVAQLAADLEETQQHQNDYQEAYQITQTGLQKLQTQLNTMNENHQVTLQQIQNWNTQIQYLKTVIDWFNITPLHILSNLWASF